MNFYKEFNYKEQEEKLNNSETCTHKNLDDFCRSKIEQYRNRQNIPPKGKCD